MEFQLGARHDHRKFHRHVGGSGGGEILANAVDTTFSGNTVSTAGSSAHGVKLDGGANFVLADNVITTSGDNSNAANIWGATVTIAGNRLSTAGLISNALDTSSSTVQITNNTVAAERGTGVRMVSTTVLAGSTGNESDMDQAQRCLAHASVGVIGLQFEDGVDCSLDAVNQSAAPLQSPPSRRAFSWLIRSACLLDAQQAVRWPLNGRWLQPPAASSPA